MGVNIIMHMKVNANKAANTNNPAKSLRMWVFSEQLRRQELTLKRTKTLTGQQDAYTNLYAYSLSLSTTIQDTLLIIFLPVNLLIPNISQKP